MKKTILFLLIYSSASMADVLFIDLNNVELEINVARQAAKLRGEKLIVLPLERDTYKNPVRVKLVKRLEELSEQTMIFCNESKPGSKAKCEKANNELDKVESRLEKMPVKSYTAEKLKEELKSVKEKISSIIISGHDGDGSFHGEFGYINGNEFLDTLSNFSGRDNVKSLYLLGCNSATTHTLAGTWKAALPKANFIAGYEGIGYLRDNGLGHAFIKKVMAEEQNIVSSSTMSEAMKRFRDISPKDKGHGTAASVILNCNSTEPIYLSSTNSASNFSELFGCPKDFTKKVNAFLECALSENSPCPLDTAEEINQRLSQPGSCNYLLHGELDESTKMRNQVYFLDTMAQFNSVISPRQLFRKAPEKLMKDLKIVPEELKTYPQIKEKLLAAKKYYDDKFDFNAIKDMPMEELITKASEKKYFDQAWIAVSNLDLSAAIKLQDPGSNLGGEIRAQAFYKALKAGENVGSYKERIAAIVNEKEMVPSFESSQNFDKEIQLLKQYQTENP